jgi:hypothetical protein
MLTRSKTFVHVVIQVDHTGPDKASFVEYAFYDVRDALSYAQGRRLWARRRGKLQEYEVRTCELRSLDDIERAYMAENDGELARIEALRNEAK